MVDLRTGNRVVLGSNHAGGTSLRNFDNSVYPALPASFLGDTKSRSPFYPMYMPGEVK